MSNTKKILVAQHLIEGQFPVMWYRTGEHQHLVTYGAESYKTIIEGEAAETFAGYVLHQANCDGRLNA